ncbi:hypothetical protein C8F01DRAFT_1017006 [Mycena amicta]|nr:hypothetical protein C8F01DRAFT_1017006 [Mycena amicta]
MSSSSRSELGTTTRPKLARARQGTDSELFASYYQSPLADAGISYAAKHKRSLSGESTSSSDYSSDDSSSEHAQPPRRSSVPSEGGADRRRLAIVQMDVPETSKAAVARRGLNTRLDGIALVAPPDAKSSTYIDPPFSAPLNPSRSMAQVQADDKPRHRSASEAPIFPKKLRIETASESLQPLPVIQEPHSSRSPTPNSLSGPKRRSTDISAHTPEIGESKRIDVPVAAPVVVDLGLDSSISPTTRRDYSAYLNYEPGVHATAGPLPPPPKHSAAFPINPSTPPPPRPPRLHSPPPRRKEGLQLPGVSAVLGSSGSNTPSSSNSRSVSPARPLSSSGDDSSNDETLHRREGAFSPSVISTTPSTSPSDYSPPNTHAHRSINGMIAEETKEEDALPPVVVSAPQPTDEWTHISRDLMTSPSSEDHASQDGLSWESFSQEGFTPSPPPKGFKASLTTGLRRISSLPRTPSPKRRSLARSSSTRSHGKTPSPSVPPVPLPVPSPPIHRRRPKIIEQYPAALFSADILSRKSGTERCVLYAQKINELYVHDSGLADWVVFRGSNGGKRGTMTAHNRNGPQPRHVSHSSIKSEATQATFPRRPDAMVATDLTTKPSDIAPIAPTLPYPALSPRSMTSTLPPPSSLRLLGVSPAKTGNFFSTLGRKASMSKKERPNMSFSLGTTATTTRLVKSPPSSHRELAPSRPLLAATAPSVPGGPRAPPNRAQKTQSISPISSPFASNASVVAARRPSLFTPTTSSSSSSSAPDRALDNQVDKLADLLPHAERAVLAGYLRRAGQDMLAIGQYLEDEKNGTIRRD